MDKREKDKRLIKESIEHWDRLIEIEPFDGIENRGKEYPGWKWCALCREYYLIECIACPISIKTKSQACIGSPYRYAIRAWNNCHEYGGSIEEWQQAATKMRDWLKDLYEDYNNTSRIE